jgi:AcrR family transcriptional regulator
VTPVATRRARARKGEGELLRDEIVAATEALLVETGDASAVSVRAIADAVGVTPPSIYLHFADKRELLYAVSEAHFTALDQWIEAAVAGATDPVDALARRAKAYVEFGVENPEHYRILFMLRPDDVPEGSAGRLLGSGPFGHLVEAVERAMVAGAIPAGDAHLIATGLWAVVHGVTSLLIAKPDFPWPDVDTLLEHLLVVQCRGLAPG